MIPNIKAAKFTSSYAKGSLSERIKYANTINTKILKNAIKLFPLKRIHCNAVAMENCYKSCLPEKKNIIIYPLKNNKKEKYDGKLNFITENNEFAGYEIELPMKNNEKINIINMPTLIHESTHILDYLLNPKYFINDNKFNKLEEFDKFNSLYENLFYKSVQVGKTPEEILKNIEEVTKNTLREENSKTKILIYNYIRYSLEMEQHAYAQDEYCTRKLKKLGKPLKKSDL